MKKMNKLNSRGFTLIELLAVIVILAIVMVLASTTVLPFMRNASRDAFGLEANALIDSASNAVSLLQIGTIDSQGKYEGVTNVAASDFKKTAESGGAVTYCFSLKYLVETGLFDLDSGSLNTKSLSGTDAQEIDGYVGTVVATKAASKTSYTYTVSIANKDFYVKGATNTVDETDNVKQMTDNKLPAQFKYSCAN